MSWIITGSFAQPDEPEALDYIAAVEAADGQTLEDGVKFAYNSFIKGCKADGIWDAIKASCILAGARTLNGALVPLVGTAPTNFNFEAGDYNRKTGLVGDGSSKYLNTNRSNEADPLNNTHLSVYATKLHTTGNGRTIVGELNHQIYGLSGGTTVGSINRGANGGLRSTATGFLGMSRAQSISYTLRTASINYTEGSVSSASQPVASIGVIGRPGSFSDARIAFYSIGEALDLALLDTRVTTLMSDLAAAIP